ncbi:flavin monoamine oxidase family protein [Sphingomonas crocodyli]|uniref:Tryptophan 2-monooxygenase n=1 Tax=Sphingomonas crocodyli TaxID=1979270 RepID=A0A437M7Y4_9SPHN|nr:flavin monoamine oxidase family protein [Sphingomonas crocodyli]RVT93831.1 flavin monoamine oxidase family protein [Sphingomonas crocodyli]
MTDPTSSPAGAFVPSRRQLLTAIGKAGGAAALYHAMTAMGHAEPSQFRGPPKLSGAKKGASVLVLGAGLAGMLAAYELMKAGYKVRLLEYQNRPGGRNWTVRGGDVIQEIGGAVQKVGFSPGNYLNPGPWRIPYHHEAVLHYCQEFGVALEPFVQINHNGYVHSSKAFGGKPVRYGAVGADFKGHVAELLAKAVNKGALDDSVTKEDKDKLLEAMKGWGILDKDMKYVKSLRTSSSRGYDRPPGGGVNGAPIPSEPYGLTDVLDPRMWMTNAFYFNNVMQTSMFQPVGGMDMIGKGFAKQLPGMITYNAKVTKIAQSDSGVTISYEDLSKGGAVKTASADYCVCTIPLTILSQIEVQASPEMIAAIKGVPYHSSCKVGLEMKRRFWEEDEKIYGGHSFTNQSISQLSYPSWGFFKKGPAVLLGAYAGGAAAYAFGGMTPEQRVEEALKQGSVFHPESYRKEFMNGTAVAWSRLPWIAACATSWNDEARKAHYQNLVKIDGRLVLAGEHASYIGAWMEASLLSSLDAIQRLHAMAQAA